MSTSTKIRAILRSALSEGQRRSLKRSAALAGGSAHRRNLVKLALLFGSDKESVPDKYGGQHYAGHYEHHFNALRRRRLRVLEIGVGGYAEDGTGGNSLRMWKSYFRHSRIFGVDIQDKSHVDEKRIRTFRGDQTDAGFLQRVVAEMGGVDIVVDDGSHVSEHVVASFHVLFPLLAPNGIYVVEDTQTSYWAEVAGIQWGGSPNLSDPSTSMNFFKSLVDGLNFEEFPLDEYEPSYYDRHIVAMHFYHNLVFIQKGLNNEGGSGMLGYRHWADPASRNG